MTYLRVIPRDLFNEGNLLKCYGRLWILLDETRGHNARLGDKDGDHSGEPFEVMQNEATGGITLVNLPFTIGGEVWRLERPLNSRETWPLYCINVESEDEIAVFDDDGRFTSEFVQLIKAGEQENDAA